MLRFTKGTRVSIRRNHDAIDNDDEPRLIWQGGTESAVFNELEAIARSRDPCTPVFKAKITRALNPQLVKNDVSVDFVY